MLNKKMNSVYIIYTQQPRKMQVNVETTVRDSLGNVLIVADSISFGKIETLTIDPATITDLGKIKNDPIINAVLYNPQIITDLKMCSNVKKYLLDKYCNNVCSGFKVNNKYIIFP